MNTNSKWFSSLIVGCYGWVITVFFGGILVDIMYFHILVDDLGLSERQTVFSEVSDFLLIISIIVIIAAVAAIAIAWKSKISRSLFFASLLFVFLELVTPVIFSLFIQAPNNGNLGVYIRLILSGSASIIAYFGLFTFHKKNKMRET